MNPLSFMHGRKRSLVLLSDGFDKNFHNDGINDHDSVNRSVHLDGIRFTINPYQKKQHLWANLMIAIHAIKQNLWKDICRDIWISKTSSLFFLEKICTEPTGVRTETKISSPPQNGWGIGNISEPRDYFKPLKTPNCVIARRSHRRRSNLSPKPLRLLRRRTPRNDTKMSFRTVSTNTLSTCLRQTASSSNIKEPTDAADGEVLNLR